MTAQDTAHWDKVIAVEEIGGVPFRMYTQRPRRIGHLFPFAARWGTRAHIVQGERVVTFDDLRLASTAKMHQLVEQGVAPGERILLLGWNSPEWIVNFWACVRIGAVPVLANAWWSEAEIRHALTVIGPALTLADERNAAKLPPDCRRGSWDMDEAAPAASHGADSSAMDENAPAAIIFTSGTEGNPKAVVLSHRSLIATQQMLLHVTRRLPFSPGETFGEVCLHTGPLFHIGGIGALLRGVMLGNTLVFPKGRFDPAEALELIERHKVSRWNAVPTMATRLLDEPSLKRRNLSTLRTMTLGGAPVHEELLRRIRERLPDLQARVATGYGLSENAGQATAASGAEIADRPGSSGRPLPLVEIKIVPRPDLADGEILVRSPTQMVGYFGGETSPIDHKGWLHTGDLGRVDERGHLWITGRSKDIIIRGGENVAPAAVERALLRLPGVVDAAVLGLPHPELGEEVAAFVVMSGSQTVAQLQESLHGSVASFAIPNRWWLQSEPLPVNQTGKVDKPALIARATADRALAGAKAS